MCTHNFRGLMMAMVTLIFGAGLMIISSEPLYADVKIERKRSAHPIEISNTITKKDADDIAQHVGDFEDGIVVTLNSPGGDVDAAMQIGRIRRGVNTAEIRRRNFERRRCSGQPEGWFFLVDGRERVCAEATMWGLSESVFTRREKEAEDKCRYSDEEKAKLDLVPARKRPDHPVKQKQDACIRNIMLGR